MERQLSEGISKPSLLHSAISNEDDVFETKPESKQNEIDNCEEIDKGNHVDLQSTDSNTFDCKNHDRLPTPSKDSERAQLVKDSRTPIVVNNVNTISNGKSLPFKTEMYNERCKQDNDKKMEDRPMGTRQSLMNDIKAFSKKPSAMPLKTNTLDKVCLAFSLYYL